MRAAFNLNRLSLGCALAGAIAFTALSATVATAATNLISVTGPTNQARPTLSEISPTNQLQDADELARRAEQIRTTCINGRRRICGQVLQIVPGGLVVDSGFTSLLRPELSRSWVVRNNVSASRPPDLVEGNTPGTVCVGLVFLTDIPKRPAVKVYDYVVLEAYPAGQYIYTPVPTVEKTIRRFAGGLLTATKLNLRAGEK